MQKIVAALECLGCRLVRMFTLADRGTHKIEELKTEVAQFSGNTERRKRLLGKAYTILKSAIDIRQSTKPNRHRRQRQQLKRSKPRRL